MRTLALVFGLACAGCTLDRAGSAADASADSGSVRDGSARDAARRDGGSESERDAGRDSGAADAGPPDAGPADAGPPDAGRPDAGRPDAGVRPCDEIFRGVDGYRGCDETETQCRFYARTAGVSCATLCRDHGATCFDSWAEASDSDSCRALDAEYDCGYGHGDGICLCSRP